MPDTIATEVVTSLIFDGFKETFEDTQGIYLDKGTTLFETLATISAEEASRPLSANCATLAAQVEHVRFYMEVLERYMQGENVSGADWGAVWRTVSAVTPEEWEASKARLRATYERIVGEMREIADWNSDNAIGGPLGIIIHTAYHLGEIRQALCTLKPDR